MKEGLKNATHVKKCFGREYMWVKIAELRDDCIVGIVDNIPILEGSPRFGEEVTVLYDEVKDAL